MKSKLPLIAVALALAFPSVRADDNTCPPPPPPSGEHGPEHKGGQHPRLKFLAEKLGLTEDQKTKIKAILEDEMKAGRAIHEDKALDKKAKWAKMEENRKTHREQIRAVLTPEQQKKFDELKEEHGHQPGGPGKPAPDAPKPAN